MGEVVKAIYKGTTRSTTIFTVTDTNNCLWTMEFPVLPSAGPSWCKHLMERKKFDETKWKKII